MESIGGLGGRDVSVLDNDKGKLNFIDFICYDAVVQINKYDQ